VASIEGKQDYEETMIVCCDGTWNAPEINNPRKNRATNVLKLCRAIIPEPSPQECQVVEETPAVLRDRWTSARTCSKGARYDPA
jgi:hypothetical protein